MLLEMFKIVNIGAPFAVPQRQPAAVRAECGVAQAAFAFQKNFFASQVGERPARLAGHEQPFKIAVGDKVF